MDEALLELTPKKDVLFIVGDWNAKVGSQETPAVTGKFGLGIRNEAGQRLIEFCQENALVITNHSPQIQPNFLPQESLGLLPKTELIREKNDSNTEYF